MKILVVSLLRLGDILLSSPVIKNLRRNYPDSNIDLLINSQFSKVGDLVPNVNKIYCFDREGLQEIIGSRNRHLFEAYNQVDELVQSLKSESYDMVLNLTHNRLSGWLVSLIGCPDTRGAVYSKSGFQMGSPWFEYLDELGEKSKGSAFHFVDIFHYGTKLRGSERSFDLHENPDSASRAQEILSPYKDKKIIFLQSQSFEDKKTLPMAKWESIANQIAQSSDKFKVIFLASQKEKAKIQKALPSMPHLVVDCDLDVAFSLLKMGEMLVTCDTSIKHLASATKIKILEISLGSSDYQRTGVYKKDSIILQGNAPCAPCSHSTSCSQLRHICGDNISPDLVVATARAQLSSDWNGLRALAEEFSENATWLKTHVGHDGDWSAIPMSQKLTSRGIAQWIDRASAKMLMMGSHRETIGEFGTEGEELKSLLRETYPELEDEQIKRKLISFEKEYESLEKRFADLLKQLQSKIGGLNSPDDLRDISKELETVSSYIDSNEVLEGIGISSRGGRSSGSDLFSLIRSLKEKLIFGHQRSSIGLKLVRNLQNNLGEN